MSNLPISYLNFFRNIKGRYDFMLFLCKWDRDYRKDLLITLMAFGLFGYSVVTWNTIYDLIAMAIEAGIIMVQLGGEMSILPPDYRPSHGGVQYSAQNSTHIAYDELSYLMSSVYPTAAEEKLGFKNPFLGQEICRESPLVSNSIDDMLIMREKLPYQEEKTETNYIRSRHQLRYIAIRVADKRQHTTNGEKLALYDLMTALTEDRPMIVRKSYYFDALLTAEAFRSRIFRKNLEGGKELYTDLTTYFPVEQEKINSADSIRFVPDFYKQVSGHIGITTLLLTENRRVAMLVQGSTKAIGSHTVTFGGSGSMSYSDIGKSSDATDLRIPVSYAMARELCEETGMEDWFSDVRQNTLVTGFFRWIDRCGKPEFVGITRATDVPFSKMRAIDGDEVVKYDEIPVNIHTLEDFHRVMDYIRDNKLNVALSSLMALHRLTVIAGYKNSPTTDIQKHVYQKVSDFVLG